MSTVRIDLSSYQYLGDDENTYLPTIDNGYGIDFKVPFIGTDGYVPFPSNRSWDYYFEGEQYALEWKDYTPYCNNLSTKQNFYYLSDFTDKHTILLNGYNDDIGEDVLEGLKASFNNDVAWIWGSLDEGGCCLIKSASSTSSTSTLSYRILMIYGLMEREPNNPDYSDGKYYYLCDEGRAGDRLSLNSLKHVAWHISKESDGDRLTLFVAGTNWNCASHEEGGIQTVYGLEDSQSPISATNNPQWESKGVNPVNTPARIWCWDGGTDNQRVYFYNVTLVDTIWSSGNPFSEDEFGSDPSGTGGITTGGGYGTPSQDTGDVDGENADDLNLLTAINSGLATLYNPSSAELSAFASFLYTGITDSIATQLKKLVTNPLDYILFVALCKFNPTTSGREEISFAGVGSGVSAPKIVNQFMEIDCGTISYSEQFKSFLDYAPISSVKLYLPFCSTVDLNVDDIMGSRINVNYLIDLLSGCCIARVKITREVRSTAPHDSRVNDVLYEFQGNVYLTMPISATDWRGAYQSLVGLAGGVVGGIASGGVGGALAIASSVASSVTSQKVSVGRSGQAGSTYGYMNNKKPYLILERPIQSTPSNFGAFEGYMSNNYTKISKLSGYTEFDQDTVWTDFGGATEEECEMIKTILNGGVYL